MAPEGAATENPALAPPANPTNAKEFVEVITEPVKQAVLAGRDGAEIAAALIMQYGSNAVNFYNQACGMGQGFGQLVAMYPPLGSFAAEHAEQFEAFLVQFLDAPRVEQIIAASQQPRPRKVNRPAPPQPPTQ